MSKKLFPYLPFLIIFLLALFLRSYRLSTLTTFGRDQGIDFQTIKQMIDERKPTLIGIQVSLAEFHQGPIYLYILVPFFLLLKMDPIAGAYAAVVISLLTLIAIYITCKKYFGKKAALFSSALFAASAELVREGNSPLYQHFLPLFIVLAIFILLKLFETKEQKKKLIWLIFLGFIVGICLELHFLAITLALAVLILLIIQKTKLFSTIPAYFMGMLVGVSPTIFFELRHEFLNTKLFLSYLSRTSEPTQPRNLYHFIFPWIDAQMKWFGADKFILGIILLVLFILALFIRFKDQRQKILKQLLLLTLATSFFFQFGISDFLAHYLIPVLVLELLLFPVWISQLQSSKKFIAYFVATILILVNAFVVISGLSANHGYSMTNGWSLQKIQKVAQIITDDNQGKSSVNVASLLDGDARTYPLRYSLSVKRVTVDSPENYSRSKVVYVVSKTTEGEIINATLWEIDSFKPFVIGEHWELGEDIRLYRLEK